MIIAYRPPNTPDYVTLFDEANALGNVTGFDSSSAPGMVPEFAPDFSCEVQEDPLFESDAQYRNPLGNVKAVLSLVFQQVYASRQDALASVRKFNTALLGQAVQLQVIQDGETTYYPNAVANRYRPRLQGQAVEHSLVFNSDNVQTTPPNP